MTEVTRLPHPMFIEPYEPGIGRKKKYTETIACTITPLMREALEREAWKQGVAMSHLVRCLISEGLQSLNR